MVVKNSKAVLAVVAVAAVFYLLGSFVGLPFVDDNMASGDIGKANDNRGWTSRIKEAVVTEKVPKKLKTYDPFWGLPMPLSGTVEDAVVDNDIVYFRTDTTSFPKWITWNLDLASVKEDRYKFERFLAKDQSLPCSEMLCAAVDECYRWAWRKPYGNTNVVMGPLFNKKDMSAPYAYFVAVCKQERLNVPMPLGFTSLAYVIPVNAEKKNVYNYSLSVNALEHHCGYTLFPNLPAKVKKMVKEMTDYEILCSFQEVDPVAAEQFQPEMERPDAADDLREDNNLMY